MSAGECVVRAFHGRGKRANAAQLTIGEKLFAPARQQFVGVCLMAYVPYNSVFGRVVNVVQSNGELNYAQARSKVSGVHRHLFYNVLA